MITVKRLGSMNQTPRDVSKMPSAENGEKPRIRICGHLACWELCHPFITNLIIFASFENIYLEMNIIVLRKPEAGELYLFDRPCISKVSSLTSKFATYKHKTSKLCVLSRLRQYWIWYISWFHIVNDFLFKTGGHREVWYLWSWLCHF